MMLDGCIFRDKEVYLYLKTINCFHELPFTHLDTIGATFVHCLCCIIDKDTCILTPALGTSTLQSHSYYLLIEWELREVHGHRNGGFELLGPVDNASLRKDR